MSTLPYKWRTINNNYVYVDSDTGSDTYGDGTMNYPYQTLGKAYRSRGIVPSTIICRGLFSEDMADGNHSCAINGDYYGAAVFDGQDEFIIYGFTHSNMIIKNCPPPTSTLSVFTKSPLLAGVGRADGAGVVGGAYAVYGVAAASTLVERCSLYWGAVGGNNGVAYQVIASPLVHPENLIWFGGHQNCDVSHMSIYDIPYAIRRKGRNGNGFPRYCACIFGKVAFYGDEPVRFLETLFTSDCEWYYNNTLINIEGETSSERETSLMSQLEDLGIAEALLPKFSSCRFTTKTSDEIWNNPSKGDFTLKMGSDVIIDGRRYYGALPPSLNIPILNNSDGIPSTWDESSAVGILSVADNAICYNDGSTDTYGEILSKIITINNTDMWVGGVFAEYVSQFTTNHFVLNKDTVFGEKINVGSILSEGLYYADSDTTINSNGTLIGYVEGDIINALDNDVFEIGTTLTQLLNSNINNVCYIRSTPAIYRRIKSSDGLQEGGIYLNYGNKTITYRGVERSPMESFVAVNNTDTFTCVDDEDYTIGIMFDDDRVPTQPWISAQMFGEYFVSKSKNVIAKDFNNEPISSGNYLAWQRNSNGGYADSVKKSVMNDSYCQFKIIANKMP